MSESERDEWQDQTLVGSAAAPEGDMLLAPGALVLERFQVIGLLGKGGMGSVFHVRHLHLQSEFALKVLHKLADANVWKRFENEARAASRLDHPNLIKVHDSGLLPDGQPFFIMEMVHGETLADMIKKNGRIPLMKALKIFIQVGFALAYAHEIGIIHRDLKPSNIMIAKNQDGSLISTVKVVDLGIAKLTGIDEFNQQTLTRTGEIFGSPLYMSPEQCIGGTVDTRSDLYSLGCSLYEALTGAPPIMGENALSTMMKHQSQKPLSLREASLGIPFPAAVEDLVAKLLEKDPNKRFANAQLLTQALVQIEQTLNDRKDNNPSTVPVAGAVAPKPEPVFSSPFKRENLPLLLMIAGAFALGFATSMFVHSQTLKTEAPEQPEKYERYPHVIEPLREKPKEIALSQVRLEPISTISKDGKTRIFNFPIDSIGLVQLGGQAIKPASGVMTAPIDAEVLLDLKGAQVASPDLLNRFAADDLTHLVLNDKVQTDLSVLTALPRFTRLKSLKIAMDVSSDAFVYIDRIAKLDTLYLNYTGIRGDQIAKLKRFPNLIALGCSNMSNIKPILDRLPGSKIVDLRIDDNQLTAADLKQIARLKGLKILSLSGNEQIDDQALKELTPLKNLVYLYMLGGRITAQSAPTLKHLKSLRELLVSTMSQTDLAVLKRELKGVKIREE